MRELFAFHDAATGDGLSLALRGEHLLIEFSIDGATSVLLLTEGRRVGRLIAEILVAAFASSVGAPLRPGMRVDRA